MQQRALGVLILSCVGGCADLRPGASDDATAEHEAAVTVPPASATDPAYGEYVKCGDGGTPDWQEIQDALMNTPGSQVIIAAGTCNISQTIVLDTRKGLHLSGQARGTFTTPYGTQLVWTGNSTDPMFRLTDVSFSTFEHFTIQVGSGFTLDHAIEIQTDCTGSCTNDVSQHDVFNDIEITSDAGTLHNGIYMRLPASHPSDDIKNDHHRFTNIHIRDFTGHGFKLEGKNSKAHTFVGCVCSATTSAQSCVNSNLPTPVTDVRSGSFSWYGGTVTGMTDAAFLLGRAADSTHISGVYSEKSRKFLSVPFSNGGDRPFPIVLSAVDFESSSAVVSTEAVVDVYSPGPLVIQGSQFGSYGVDSSMAPLAKPVSICWHRGNSEGGVGNAGGAFVFEGNLVTTTEPKTTNPFDTPGVPASDECRYPTTQESNLWCPNCDESVATFVPIPVFPTTLTLKSTALDSTRKLKTSRHVFEIKQGAGTILCELTDGVPGQEIILRSTAAVNLTLGDMTALVACSGHAASNIHLQNNQDSLLRPNEAITLLLADNGTWNEISRSNPVHSGGTRLVSVLDMTSDTGTGIDVNQGYVTVSPAGGTTGPYYVPCPVSEGERIRSFEPVYNRPSGSASVVVKLRRIDPTGTATTIATFTDSTNTGWRKGASGTIDHMVVADSTYYFSLETPSGSYSVSGIHIIWD